MRARSSAVLAALLLSTSARADRDGRARDVTPDPAIFFTNSSEAVAIDGEGGLLASSGRAGFHRSDTGGDLWQRAMRQYVDSSGVEQFASMLCQAPSSPPTVYGLDGAVFGGIAFRTDDLGTTWRSLGASGPAVVHIDCAVDVSNAEALYVLAFDLDTFTTVLLKSTDGGQTRPALPGFSSLDNPVFVRVGPPLRRRQPSTVYVGNLTGDDNDGLYVSYDGGNSFTHLPGSGLLPFKLAAHPTRAGTLFLITIDGRLLRSTDGGASFTSTDISTPQYVTFDPNEASTVYVAAGAHGLYRSRNSGNTFVRLSGPAAAQVGPVGVINVGVAPSRHRRGRVYVGTDRGPYRSDDGGDTFVSIQNGYRGATANDLALDAAGRLVVGAYHTVPVYRAQDVGQPGVYDPTGASLTTSFADSVGEWDGNALAPSSIDANTLVVSTIGNGVFSTRDGGTTWRKATVDPPVELFFGSFIRAAFAPGSSSRVYLAEHNFGLFRSDDTGLSFGHVWDERFGAVAVDPVNPDVLYLGAFDTDLGLFKSVDGGRTVTSLGVPGNFLSIAIDPRHPSTIYAGNSAGGVLRSTDAGRTWKSASNGLPSGEVIAVASDPAIANRVYAWVKASGLFVSADGGSRWKASDTGEALRRSGVPAGRAAMVVDRSVPGRVYLGNSGVVQIDTLGHDD